jgi:hypothetical protein
LRPIGRGSRNVGDLRVPSLDDRLILRVSRLWDDIAGHRLFPSKNQIDDALIGNDWVNCALIEVHPDPEKSILIAVGDNLIPVFEFPLVGGPLLNCPCDALLGIVTSHLSHVLEARAPLTIGGAALHFCTPILYRGALLPFAEDGFHIDAALAVANYRSVGN